MMANKATSNLGMHAQLNMSYEQAVEKVTAALKEEGFGVLTEIDVKSTMKKKLDVDFRRYVILGACNPPLAHRALSTDPEIGLLLPCNAIVYENLDGQSCTVSIVNPMAMFSIGVNPAAAEVAVEANNRLQRVIDALAA